MIQAGSRERCATVDGKQRRRYDLYMSQARATPQSRPASEDAEREAFMAAVDEGLAELKAGRFYTHEQVQTEMRRRFPPSAK
jgi:predicted transcriptional regulator